MSTSTESDFKMTPEIVSVLKKCDPNTDVENLNLKSLEDVWEYLKKEENKLDEKLNHLKSKHVVLHDHVELLHEYNDIKDITQQVLGTLANLQGISVKEAHNKYNLECS